MQRDHDRTVHRFPSRAAPAGVAADSGGVTDDSRRATAYAHRRVTDAHREPAGAHRGTGTTHLPTHAHCGTGNAHLPTDAHLPVVVHPRRLATCGWSRSAIRAQLRARRWQRVGRAIIRHNGELTTEQRRAAALVNCGPRAVLTSFTALDEFGLTGWARPEVHVLVPQGARLRAVSELAVHVHYTAPWGEPVLQPNRPLHRLAPALVLAAASFTHPRPGCALVAAAVQQRLITPDAILSAIEQSPHCRHHAALVSAAHDIGQGAHALSEIDFVRLCRTHGLPPPAQQRIRRDRYGRRRYLDAEFRRADGRLVIVEVDGALHLAPEHWWADQSRQNDLSISGALILRFPSVVVRHEPGAVVAQLRAALEL